MLKYNCYYLLLVLGLMASGEIAAQKPYFQQRTDYKIAVSLDDTLHQLAGTWALKYVNNSPDTLQYMYIHLWANAYRNNRTALAKQLLGTGKKDWYFAPPSERGFVDNLAFATQSGELLRWEYDSTHIDIAKIYFRAPLLPGDSIELKTPFRLQFPKTISRLGHVEQSYQVTQWYPKPAVYDRKGWHQMPYLDQGEFYSEFGSFDVSITLPRNYVVGASGDLQTRSEQIWLDSLAAVGAKANHVINSTLPDTFPPSANEKKTIRYTLDRVHDFAWFADKRFYVLKDSVQMPSGRFVTVYAMFSHTEANLWKDAAMYLRRSVRFYSDVVGEYPYNVATAVQSALSAGGGMEYPTITVIGESGSGKALDEVIAHEIGHNWFYGILASNERVYPWMDEGWNSYVESRYMEKNYEGRDKQGYLAFLLQARRGQEQAVQTESEAATSLNYYVTAYAKPTLLFRHAERYLGTARMDSILHEYYRVWQFRHPYPEDLQAIFEAQTGESWQWLFDQCIGTSKRVDYAIKKYKFTDNTATITVENKGEMSIVLSIAAQDTAGKTLDAFWFGFSGKDTTIILADLPSGVASFELDAFRNMPDVQPNNNKAYVKGHKKGEKLKVKILADFRAPEKPRINLFPILGFNQYDGFMLGLAAYNLPVPLRKWQYTIAPLYGFGSKSAVGLAELQFNHFRSDNIAKKGLRGITAGISARSFHYFDREAFVIQPDSVNPTILDQYQYQLRYSKINLYGIFWLPRRLTNTPTEQYIRVDNIIIAEEVASFGRLDSTNFFTYAGKSTQVRSTHRIGYFYKDKKPLAPYSILAQAEYANYKSSFQTNHYLKLSLEANFKWCYQAHKSIDLRAFAGGFVLNTDRDFGAMPLQMASRNRNDYHYDEMFLSRRAQEGLLSRQIQIADGGFKTPIAASVADGNSNKFLLALNLKADIPIRLPFGVKWLAIKPYFDAGFFLNSAPSVVIAQPADQIMFNGGFMIDIANGAAGIYFPLFGSRNIMQQTASLGNFSQRVSFSINTKLLSPTAIARNIDL